VGEMTVGALLPLRHPPGGPEGPDHFAGGNHSDNITTSKLCNENRRHATILSIPLHYNILQHCS
jgi:hypothetical protein